MDGQMKGRKEGQMKGRKEGWMERQMKGRKDWWKKGRMQGGWTGRKGRKDGKEKAGHTRIKDTKEILKTGRMSFYKLGSFGALLRLSPRSSRFRNKPNSRLFFRSFLRPQINPGGVPNKYFQVTLGISLVSTLIKRENDWNASHTI